ncbi:MAG: hypothetical protein QOG20_3787 [Pseudonocardiales bacterium]|jgi:hypothetical protein|nr:hypothetical protein [Pseudonocardiales bacterium]MDT7708180.1 hypothetical protein [Pseudonocardiales bacterium]
MTVIVVDTELRDAAGRLVGRVTQRQAVLRRAARPGNGAPGANRQAGTAECAASRRATSWRTSGITSRPNSFASSSRA